jgi:hypothetical protein
MTRSMPYLALDSAGKRTILCDHPIKMFDSTTKKETTKMKMNKTTLSADQLSRYVGMRIRNPAAADRYWQACTGRNIAVDAAMDDETAEKLKGFLKSRLSAEDHEQVCNMLAGGDVDAEDDLPENAAGGPLPKRLPLRVIRLVSPRGSPVSRTSASIIRELRFPSALQRRLPMWRALMRGSPASHTLSSFDDARHETVAWPRSGARQISLGDCLGGRCAA